MNYPDGSIVRVGDLVWWNEGCCLGHVQSIAETKEAYEAWGLDSPFIAISNEQPFNPANTMGVVYDETDFKDDGIGLLNVEEHEQLALAVSQAKTMVFEEYDVFCVTTAVEQGRLAHWLFEFRKSGKPVRSVTVPILWAGDG